MPLRPSKAVFISVELRDFLETLDSNHRFRKWIYADMKNALLQNMWAGQLIRKTKIPLYYIEKYGVNNLYRYSHPEGYRSCYTITKTEDGTLCPHILDLKSHSEYEKIFGYKSD